MILSIAILLSAKERLSLRQTLRSQMANSRIRNNKHSKPRYKSRLTADRGSQFTSGLLSCSSSLSELESSYLLASSSLILFCVLLAWSTGSPPLLEVGRQGHRFYALGALKLQKTDQKMGGRRSRDR